MIYSPVITSALSITSGHFELSCGLFAGQVVPTDAIQMLRRNRTTKEFIVGLSRPEYSKSFGVKANFRAELVQTLEALDRVQIAHADKDKLLAAIHSDTAPSELDLLRYECAKAQAWLKDMISITFPSVAISQGFKVSPVSPDQKLVRIGMLARRGGRKSYKEYVAKSLLASEAASASLVSRVREFGSLDESERYKVIKSRAREVLKKSSLEYEDVQFWGEGEGESKLALFKIINLEVTSLDEDLVPAVLLLKSAVDTMSNSKCWSSEMSCALYDSLLSVRYSMARLGLYVRNCTSGRAKQSSITRLIGLMGLELKRVDGGKRGFYYKITDESLGRMKSYSL